MRNSSNWYRGLFILIAKDDPNFTLIKDNTDLSSKLDEFSIDSLVLLFVTLPEALQYEYLASVLTVLQSNESQSQSIQKIINKIDLRLAHQAPIKKTLLPKKKMDEVALALGQRPDMINRERCSDIYYALEAQLGFSYPKESLLEGAMKLSLIANNAAQALSYLQYWQSDTKLSEHDYEEAVGFSLPDASNWTPSIWQSLFKNHRPTHVHDLFFKLLPHAREIEQAYRANHQSITPKEKLTAIAEVAAPIVYQDRNNPKVGTLFFKHGMTKEAYDRYKDIKIREDSQLIPDITIDGESIDEEHAPFYLAKLDKTEPVASIIGKMTGCCESVDGVGKQYIDVALTHDFAGFYVLYDRRKTKGDGIIAHCIAWRVDDTIVYSSVETNINYRDQLHMVADFFYFLAKKLMDEHQIKRVFVWELHDHTPPFVGLWLAFPTLEEMLKKTSLRSMTTGMKTLCIADIERPYLSLYAKFKQLPALSHADKKDSLVAFNQDEKRQIVANLISMGYEVDFEFWLDDLGLSHERLKDIQHAYEKIKHIAATYRYDSDSFSIEDTVNILKIAANTKPFNFIGENNSHSLLFEAELFYQIWLQINEIFQRDYQSKGLTRQQINHVIYGFIYEDIVPTPFDQVNFLDPVSVQSYAIKLFDFCLLAKEMENQCDLPHFDRARFNELYDSIYPKHPVTCMELLRKAIQVDNDMVVDTLLEKGINLNDDLLFAQTPLCYAIEYQNNEAALKLINHGAYVDQRPRGPLNNNKVRTPLEMAAKNGMEDVFEQLIMSGAKTNFISSLDQSNLLHHIAHLKDVNWVSFLVKQGLDINHLSSKRFFKYGGHTPLYEAALLGRFDMLMMMIDHDADINYQNEYGNTALHLAVLEGQLDAVSSLIKAGASISIKNKVGQTVLDICNNLSVRLKKDGQSQKFKIVQAITNASIKKNAASQSYSPKLFDNQQRHQYESHQNSFNQDLTLS